MSCPHKNRAERLWTRGQDIHAKITCKDCHADLDLDHVLALERAEEAEARVKELENKKCVRKYAETAFNFALYLDCEGKKQSLDPRFMFCPTCGGRIIVEANDD